MFRQHCCLKIKSLLRSEKNAYYSTPYANLILTEKTFKKRFSSITCHQKCLQRRVQNINYFSTNRGKLNEVSNDDRNEPAIRLGWQKYLPSFLIPLIPTSTRGWVLIGSGAVALGVSRVFYALTTSLLELTPAASLYYGFIGGTLTTISAAAVIFLGELSFRISPDRVSSLTLSILRKDKNITDLIGGVPRLLSSIKTYSSSGSSLDFSYGLPRWTNPRCEVFFLISSSDSKSKNIDALVSVVYRKTGFSEVIDYLAIFPYSNEKQDNASSEALNTSKLIEVIKNPQIASSINKEFVRHAFFMYNVLNAQRK